MAEAARQVTDYERDELPETLAEIRDVIGTTAMLALVERYGGTTIDVPAAFDPTHPLVAVLGHEQGAAFCQHFAGERLYIARAVHCARHARNREIARRYQAGTPVRTLALEHHLSDRQIWTILGSTQREPDPQNDLFARPDD